MLFLLGDPSSDPDLGVGMEATCACPPAATTPFQLVCPSQGSLLWGMKTQSAQTASDGDCDLHPSRIPPEALGPLGRVDSVVFSPSLVCYSYCIYYFIYFLYIIIFILLIGKLRHSAVKAWNE